MFPEGGPLRGPPLEGTFFLISYDRARYARTPPPLNSLDTRVFKLGALRAPAEYALPPLGDGHINSNKCCIDQ